MKICVKINDYDSKEGLKLNWEGKYKIDIKYDNGIIIISANEDGLMSLGNHFISLAQHSVPVGCHIHLDAYNNLEPNSIETIIQKI